ncbi:unnamed protein product [Symbiodinium sp. CCMP2456]|nr:unnamed protein product [Symbiodinium sp. CCMP2456]
MSAQDVGKVRVNFSDLDPSDTQLIEIFDHPVHHKDQPLRPVNVERNIERAQQFGIVPRPARRWPKWADEKKLMWSNWEPDYGKDKFNYAAGASGAVQALKGITAKAGHVHLSEESKKSMDCATGILQGVGTLATTCAPIFGPAAPFLVVGGVSLNLVGGVLDAIFDEEPKANSRQDALGTLNQTVNVLSADVKALSNTVSDIGNKVDKIDANVQRLDGTVRKIASNLDKVTIQVDRLNSRVGKLESSVARIEDVTKHINQELQKTGLRLDRLGQHVGNIERALASVLTKLTELRQGQIDIFLKPDLEDFRVLSDQEQRLLSLIKENATSEAVLEFFDGRISDNLHRYDRLRANFETNLNKLAGCQECGSFAAAATYFHQALAARFQVFDILYITRLHRRQLHSMQVLLEDFDKDLQKYPAIATDIGIKPWLKLQLPHLAEFVQDPVLLRQHPDILEKVQQLQDQLGSASSRKQIQAVQELTKLGRAALPAVPDMLNLLTGSTKLFVGDTNRCLTATDAGLLQLAQCDDPKMNEWQWFYWQDGLRLDHNTSKYGGTCIGRSRRTRGPREGTWAAVLNPGYGFVPCSSGAEFADGYIRLDDDTAGLHLSLRSPEDGEKTVFFGLSNGGWDFSDIWVIGQHEPCAAAVKALKALGTPELSEAAHDPNKNALYKECLAAA